MNATHQVMTIDLTPTWAQAVELCLIALQDGTDKGKELAREELRRMGVLLDNAGGQRELGRIKAVIAEYIASRETNVPAGRVQDAWAALKREVPPPGPEFVKASAELIEDQS